MGPDLSRRAGEGWLLPTTTDRAEIKHRAPVKLLEGSGGDKGSWTLGHVSCPAKLLQPWGPHGLPVWGPSSSSLEKR